MVQAPQPFDDFTDISPDDTADLPFYTTKKLLTGAVYVGIGGDLVAVLADNTTQTFQAVPAGVFLPLAVRRINAQNTTASGLVACYVV